MKYHYKFGFLNIEESFEFEGGKVDVSGEFEEGREWVYERENLDGFIYPPQVKKVKLDPVTLVEIEDIPKTTRPALMYKLPNSHSISLESELENDASFIVNLLGYLYGTRLQFSDLWFDGRVPIKPTHNISVRKPVAEEFLSKSYSIYKLWNAENRKWFTNALIMHSRAPSYEWDWERFSMEYMVFDGLYRLISEIYGVHAKSHKDRFRLVFDQFGISFNDDLVEQIYGLRNGLFHQALWDGRQPCTGRGGFHFQCHLSRINNRVIPALLGFNNEYVHSPWWSIGCGRFDRELKKVVINKKYLA